MVPDSEETISFKSDGTRVFFKFSNVEILTRVIELQFPDYKSILKSAQHDKKILLNTKDFLSAKIGRAPCRERV